MRILLICLLLSEFICFKTKAQDFTEATINTIQLASGNSFYHPSHQFDLAVDSDGNKIIAGGYDGENVNFGDPDKSISSVGNSNIFIAKYDETDALLWIKNIGGITASSWSGIPEANDAACAVKTDEQNNIYVLGVYNHGSDQPVDFDPGHPSTHSSIDLTGPGDEQVFLVKYTPEGEMLWLKVLGDEYTDNALDMNLDASGNIYITGTMGGYTANNIDFDPGHTHADDKDILPGEFGHLGFIASYDSDGHFLNVTGIGGPFMFITNMSISVAPSGNRYVAGAFSGKIRFIMGDDINYAYESMGDFELSPVNPDIFIAKYSNEGKIEWVKIIGSESKNKAYSLDLDEEENVYVTGYFKGTNVDFDNENNLGYDVHSSPAATAAYIAKYHHAGGKLLWVETVKGNQDLLTAGRSIEVYDSSIVVTGQFIGSNTGFGDTAIGSIAGTVDGFIARLDTAGNWIEAVSIERPGYATVNNLAVDDSGKIHVLGYEGTLNGNWLDLTAIFFSTYYGNGTPPITGTPDEDQLHLVVYPNPVSLSILKVAVPQGLTINEVFLYNVSGQLIARYNWHGMQSDQYSLNVAHLPAGLYALTFKTDKGDFTRRIIKR